MSKTTTNYGLVKPELTDAADITAMNPNWDKIDSELKLRFELSGVYTGDMNELVLPGQYRVQSNANLPNEAYYGQVFVGRSVVYGGNNDTLCQIVVSYQNKKMFYRGAILRDGVWNFENWSECYSTNNKPTPDEIMAESLIGGTVIPDNADLNTYRTPGNYHCGGDAAAQTLSNCPVTNAFRMKVGYPTGANTYIYQEIFNWVTGTRYYRQCIASSEIWTDWKVTYDSYMKPTADDVGALPLTGGTLSGILVQNGGHTIFDGSESFSSWCIPKNIGDADNRFNLTCYKHALISDRLILEDTTNGSTTQFRIFGEYNKPSGTYTGNGDATERVIVAPMSSVYSVFVLYGDSWLGFVYAQGAVFISGTTVKSFDKNAIRTIYDNTNPENTGIKITSTDSMFNGNGKTYRYHML